MVSLDNGVKEYEGVSVIHIKSRYYNLLIMEGYTPSIGEVEGTVTIVSDTRIGEAGEHPRLLPAQEKYIPAHDSGGFLCTVGFCIISCSSEE